MTPTADWFFRAPASAIDAAAEARFFASIRLANGTFKTTAAGRMRDLDQVVARCAQMSQLVAPSVLDVAVSSGVTTFELQSALRAAGLRPSIVATDIAMDARLASAGRGRHVLEDSAGHALQYDVLGFAIRPWQRRLDYVTGYRLLSALARQLCKQRSHSSARKVLLISRRIGEPAGVRFLQDDLRRRNIAFERRFDIVRAANLLNRDYFDDATLSEMLSSLIAYLRGPGALLVLNRTHPDGSNHGSIFRHETPGGLKLIERIGRGSELEPSARMVGPAARG